MSKRIVVRTLQAIISGALTIISIHLLHYSWSVSVAVGLLSIVILGYVINSIREILINKVLLQTYSDEMENLAKRMLATVSCSFCAKANAVPFRMDTRNEFTCQHCGKPNLLMINTNTAQITTPIAGINSFNNKDKPE